ncbi:peptide chain release factor 2 [Prauserella coralliicola]|nr:peptide chain release factor 2 [Prauserella coralliicola]
MDTTRLRELVTTDGPFASVYFDDTHDTADAEKLLELRWRELRERLEGQGAERPTLDAMESAVREAAPPVGRSGRALVAVGDRVLVDQELDEPPAQPIARLSRLPYVLPLAEFGERPPAHVVAVVDHVGADVTAVDADGNVVDEQTVEGSEHPVHKVRGGGSAHRDLQSRAEETARHNINRVAEHVATTARRVGAALVVLAGESQARKELHDALPEQVRRVATELQTGARHQGGGNEELREQIQQLLAKTKQARRDEVVERFRAALGKRDGLAVQGLQATTTALREANVETLLVADPGDAEVLTGEEPTLVAVQKEELEAHGTRSVSRRRADEALAVAAIAGAAEIICTGDTLELMDGVGAILRHD